MGGEWEGSVVVGRGGVEHGLMPPPPVVVGCSCPPTVAFGLESFRPLAWVKSVGLACAVPFRREV